MSQENVEIVKRVIDAGARDVDAILALHHPEWEGFIPDEYPVAGTWRGHDGVRRFMQEWLDSFDQFSIEPGEFIDADDAVVVAVRYRGRGRSSGIETTDRWFYAYRLREGKVIGWRPYRERGEALAAVGLGA
jgi:ketosteroid isomerase-like protein